MSLLVKDVMSRSVITVDSLASAKQAGELMDKYDIGCLVVMCQGKPAGIVTERDMLSRVLLQLRDPETTIVDEIMSTPLIGLGPENSIQDAMRCINERRIKRLVVLDNVAPVGLLSVTDIVRSVAFLEHIAKSLCARCELNRNTSDEIEQ